MTNEIRLDFFAITQHIVMTRPRTITLDMIAANCGVSRSWLHSLCNATSTDDSEFGVKRCERVCKYITGEVSRANAGFD